MNKKFFCVLSLLFGLISLNIYAGDTLESYYEEDGISTTELVSIFISEALSPKYTNKIIRTEVFNTASEQNYTWAVFIQDDSYRGSRTGEYVQGRTITLCTQNGKIIMDEYTAPTQHSGGKYTTTNSFQEITLDMKSQILSFMQKSEATLKKYGQEERLTNIEGFMAISREMKYL